MRGLSILGRALFALFFLWATVTPLSASDEVRLQVPFFRQRLQHCGPAALASLLHYHGDSTSPDEIAETVFSKNAGGTLTLDLVLFARARGWVVTSGLRTPDFLKEQLRSGDPPLVLVDNGFWMIRRGHFLVVTGYNEKGYFVHDGRIPDRFLPENDFLKRWNRTGNWTLVVNRGAHEGMP